MTGPRVTADDLAGLRRKVSELRTENEQLRDLLIECHALVSYMSAGRGAVGNIGPYPDATARALNARLDAALAEGPAPEKPA